MGVFPCGSAGNESSCKAGDLGSILGLGRSPGEGKVYPLQYSGLENSMDYTAAESDTTERLSLVHFLLESSQSPGRCCDGNTLTPTFKSISFRSSCGSARSPSPRAGSCADSWLWPVGSSSLTRGETQARVLGAWRPTHRTPGKPLVPTLKMHRYSSEEPARVIWRR